MNGMHFHSHFILKQCWENEIKWKRQMGEQLLKPLIILKLLTTYSSSNTYNHQSG